MNNMKCLILTTSMGHESIAEAIRETLQQEGYDVEVVKEDFAEVTLQYQPLYQFLPKVHGQYYKMGKKPLVVKTLKKLYKRKKRKKLEKIIKRYKPNTIISTYFFYNYALEEIKRTHNFIFFNIVANPWTTHPLEYAPNAELNLVYDNKAKEEALSYKMSCENIREVGWFTRKKFFQAKSASKNEIPTILISAGSLGTSQIAKFLPILFKCQQHFRYIFVAGKNRALYKLFKRYENLCDIILKKHPKNKIIGFTDQMPELMLEADIIAGKAGPNLLFEAVAAEKPFLALTYIPGQEDGNLSIIERKDLGWIALTSKKAKEILKKFAADPELMSSKDVNIKKEKERIGKSGEKLIKYIQEFSSKENKS
jgi:UDP-N-acetylglucosamine:LPS N-acetylglucosamine transferase